MTKKITYMRKIFYIAVVSVCLSLSGCTDHLNTRNLFQQGTDNFFRNPTEIMQALSGVYDALYINATAYSGFGLTCEHILANLLADYLFAGGGPDDFFAHAAASFALPAEDIYIGLWRRTYVGVHRANTLIEVLENADLSAYFPTETEARTFINTIKGEALFLRGFLMFRAARFWGGMPLITSTSTPRDVPRASFTETFGQIAEDFNRAIELLPAVNINNRSIEEDGRVTTWVAKAYLARTFLFYTGFMTNMMNTPTTEITLPDGAHITNAQVVAHLVNVRDNSGHALVSDFRNLWPYSFLNDFAGEVVYPWAYDEGLSWAGQDGPHSHLSFGTGNPETMFSLRYSFATGWGDELRWRNWFSLYGGLREQTTTNLFGQGWGWFPVNPLLFDNWNENDPRRAGSILRNEDVENYNSALHNQFHETGLSVKKFMPLILTLEVPGVANPVRGSMWWHMHREQIGGTPDMNHHNMQDFIYLRFSDILLMHSELTQTADGINQVRARASLTPVAFSMETLMDERKHEFAFEGIRWFDILRWGAVNNPAQTYFGRSVPVYNDGVATTHTVNFRAETRGLLPIPATEMRLSDGVYQQNPGW
jgi:hypothetical protein